MAIQDKFNKPNVIYKITKDIDLGGETLTIPEGCTLDFQGGSFSNGTIVGLQCVSAPLRKIFNNISFAESRVDKWNAEWFGDVINDFPSTYQNIENSLPEYSSVYVNSNITFGDTINILKRINLFFLDITFTSSNKDVFVYGNKSNGITNVTFKANNIRYNLQGSDNVYAQTNSFLKLKSCSFCNFDFYTCSNIGIPIYFYPEGSCGQNIFKFNKIFNGNKGVYFSNGISTDWDSSYWCEGNQFFFGFIVRYKIGVELENFIKAKANLYVGAIDCVEVGGLDILDNSNKERYFTKSVWLLNFYRLGDSVIDEYDTFLDPSYGLFTAGSVYAKGEIHSVRAIRTNELLNIKAFSNGRIDFNDYSGIAEDYLARIMLTSEGDLTIQGNRGISHRFMKYWMKSPLNGSKTIGANSDSITISHTYPLPNANYGISVSPSWNTSWWIHVKNQNGFVIGFSTPPAKDSSVDYTIYGI